MSAPDPQSVRIWRDDYWWRLVGDTWTAVETRAGGAQWTAPSASGVPADLQSVGEGALVLSGGYPIAVALSNGALYLFTSEWGGLGARQLVGAAGASALVSLPTPPLIVVLRPHPLGRRSVEVSTEYVRGAIERYKSNPFLAQWVRQTIHAANLPDPRGRPNPDNVVAALFAQQKREMAFVNDPLHGELMASPSDLLCLDPEGRCLRGGDCDDQIIVLGSAVASAGISVRLRVRRYPNSKQAHVTLEYRVRDGSWKCIDPSTDTGTCSTAPYLEEVIMHVVDEAAPRLEFVGLGSPDDGGPLGAPDELELGPQECEAAVSIALTVHDVLSRSAARLRQNVRAAEGLGAPADETASRLIATADLLTDAIEDGCRGDRPLSVTVDGDLRIGSREADTFAMTLGEDNYPIFADPAGSDHSLSACYRVAQSCDRMASVVCANALGEPPPQTEGLGALVLPSDVLAYRAAWDPFVMGIARGLTSCAASWRLLAQGHTVPAGDPTAPNVSQFVVPPDATALGLFADTLAQEGQSLVDSWNLHAGATDYDIVLEAGAFLQDYQATVARAGTFYAGELKKNCPSIVQPSPPTLLEQTQIIARIEGLGILAHGVLQLWGIGASGALETYGAIAKKAGDIANNATGSLPFGIGGVVLGVGLTLGALYLLGRAGVFGVPAAHRVANVNARGRRRRRATRARSRRASYRQIGALSAGRLYAERIRLNQGYDSSGLYWGVGEALYRVSDADGDLDVYVRAPDAKTAKTRVEAGQGSRR